MLTMVMVAAVALGFIILSATFIMTRPIRELTQSANRIARGDGNIQFPIFGDDEVGMLSRSIKAMYEHLEKSRENLRELANSLETQIEQRTRQLVFEVEQRKRTGEELKRHLKLEEVISRLQSGFIADKEKKDVFDHVLGEVLDLTDSDYGFIGEVLYDKQDQPHLKTYVLTDISWDEETRKFYEQNAPGGMEFRNLDSLYGAVMKTGKPVIADDPGSDPRSGGLPEGHPHLKAFLGLPLIKGRRLIGMIGVANRPGGYDNDVVKYTRPLAMAIGNIIEALRTEDALRESENRFRALYEKAPLGYQSLDMDGNFIEVNQAWLDMLGYAREEVIGKPFADFIADKNIFKESFPNFKQTGETHLRQCEMLCKDGSSRIVSINGRIGYDERGELQQTHSILTDITERKLKDDRIKASLAEKEVLLKEIHHRVKNNLQVVSSMLSLQAGAEKDANVVEALNESERRVRVMARVHENLYRAGDLAHVNAREYLNAIVRDAKMSHGVSGIAILEDVDDISMDIERAIPIGQIVSELISNSFKHGFGNSQEGTVTLSLKRRGDKEVELIVSDDGVGLPEGFELENSDTLGLKLVTSLATNLDGKITVGGDKGTKVGIKFAGGGGRIW